jgi:hypothetical protein
VLKTVAVCTLLAATHPGIAAADGETSPMFGLAAVGGEVERSPMEQTGLAGVGVDVAWWHGPFGLAAEGSARWSVDSVGARAFVLGGSARLRVAEGVVPSLIEPRDCELALELQAIVERAWWDQPISEADAVSYGLGLALRLRGGGDLDASSLIAESRFFVRVMTARWDGVGVIARTMEPVSAADRSMTVLAGVGASWGTGAPSYVEKFRMHPFRGLTLW